MSIALVAYGADSNGGFSASSSFCGFVQPVGIQNGDIVIVAIALPAANVVVTPPDATWQELARTDPTRSFGLSVWWTTALNLPSDIVFALSSASIVSGTLVAYRGSDPFQPIDAVAPLLTANASTVNVAGISTSQNAEELVLFIAEGGQGVFVPASGFIEATSQLRTATSMSAQHRAAQNAGAFSSFSEFHNGTTALGASVLIALAPSASTMTYDDVYQRLKEALPPGADNLLDFTPGQGDFYFYFWCIAAILKLGYDLVDLVRLEIVPFLSRYKLPDWERIFALSQTPTSQLGTIPQRQGQVLGAWRAAAGLGSAISVVQATLAPLLGYLPSTIPQIIEANPAALKAAHSYGFAADVVIGNGTTGTTTIYVPDGGKISNMGAQLALAFSTASLSPLSVTLTGPDGATATWSTGWSTSAIKLYARAAFAGRQIFGTWTLSVTNNTGSSVTLQQAGSTLFVEGIGRGQDTGGAIYWWGVYADPAHVGENGSPADFNAARTAIKKLAQSHTVGDLIQSLAPWPDVVSGVNAAIPDECIPV